jgi:UDP-N-acetyl-D-mannosaminuronate dehydrogenase
LESILGNNVRKAENMKTAEIAALFTILQQDVKNALEHELAHFCEKAGADILEIRRLLENSNNTCLSLPAFSERSIDERSYLLLNDAESYDTRFQVLEAARGVNEETVRHAVNLVKDALKSCDKTMRRARISLLGVSQTPNMKNTPKKAVKEIVKMLEAKGAKVNLYDPYLSEKEPTETQQRPKKNLSEVVEGADCLVVLTGHDQFKRMNLGKLKLAMKMPAAIVDLEGILEPDKIEKEGFIYRGLGRGVWTK